MKQTQIVRVLTVVFFVIAVLADDRKSAAASAQPSPQPRTSHVADLKAPDGIILKASYFAAAKPGPGVLLYHQSNRTRQSWDDVAAQLAAAGINTLTVDTRGYGESGGKKEERDSWRSADLDAAFQYLVSQPGVSRDAIGAGGAGWLGVDCSVETARRHPGAVKSLAMLSGETLRPQLQFLHEASQLPELFVVSDGDEYPPTRQAMEWLYVRASSSSKKFIHYSEAKDAPWLWYESSNLNKIPPATGNHGTDLFKTHHDLCAIIVDWFVTTLIRTPGHAPVDALASAQVLNQLETPGGVAQVTQQLMETRRKDPHAQLFPEVNVDIIGEDYQRDGDVKAAIEVFKLNLLAYPNSADAHYNLANAYLADGQKDLARQYAEKGLAMLDSHAAPLSSWSDTEQRRGEIRNSLMDVLKQKVVPP